MFLTQGNYVTVIHTFTAFDILVVKCSKHMHHRTQQHNLNVTVVSLLKTFLNNYIIFTRYREIVFRFMYYFKT